jgi:1-acyl-sn-glycerol-3-phosphate acyltransferase
VSAAENGRPGLGDVLRSVAFYAAFYLGTLPYIVAALVAVMLGHGHFLRLTHNWSRYHRACMRLFLGIRVEVTGVAPARDALIAVKHESFYEALDLPMLFGTPAIFAKAELLRIPVWGWLGRRYGLIPVERDQGAKALRAMIAAARAQAGDGRLLVIFPEGTRVPHGVTAELQPGFAGLYKLLAMPVVPVAVDSGPLYHRWWKRRGTIHVRIGAPIPPGLPRGEVEARVHAAINVLAFPRGSRLG